MPRELNRSVWYCKLSYEVSVSIYRRVLAGSMLVIRIMSDFVNGAVIMSISIVRSEARWAIDKLICIHRIIVRSIL